MIRILTAGAAVATLALVAGCGGGRKIVTVSGIVTVNGEPAANVIVSFQPLGDRDDPNPGRGSSAYTGADGRFTLYYDGNEKLGALTGRHRVKISPQFVSDKGPEGGKGGGGVRLNVNIPPEWNDISTVEFEVPAGGTDKADFHIQAPPPKR